jgi:5-methyltetrahydrofolate--homocysteine methyltransferase
MQRQGFTTPLLIGGATTSKMHTAVKIDPHYDAPVIYVADASRCVNVASRLLGSRRDEFCADVVREYDHFRERFQAKLEQREFLSLAASRANRLETNWNSYQPPAPKHSGIQQLIDFPLDKLRDYIDWTPFFSAWELRAKYPRVLAHERYGEEARKLFADAELMLEEWIASGKVRANAVFGLLPANSIDHDDIEIYRDESRGALAARVVGLRQQTPHPGDRANLSLADFIAPRDSGVSDYIGAFAVTAGIGLEQLVADYEQEQDVYNAMLAKALADRLAEAFAEYLHHHVRTEAWGYAGNEALAQAEIIKEQYRGIRPAPGYPANPDHQQKLAIWDLLEVEKATGISLTESLAMWPASAVSGWYFSHPESEYFAVGKIAQDQVSDYARRAGVSLAAAEENLAPNLGYLARDENDRRVA